MLALLTVALVACSANKGDEGGTREPPPIETQGPTVSPDADCPYAQTICVFGRQIEGWLKNGDFGAVVRVMRPQSITCPAPPRQGSPALPVCEGAAGGETRQGYGLSRRYSEGAAVSADGMQQALRSFLESVDRAARDDVGAGDLKFFTIGCDQPQGNLCSRYAYVFSAVVVQEKVRPHRELLIFYAASPAPTQALEVVEVRTGIILPGEEAVFQGDGRVFDLGELRPAP